MATTGFNVPFSWPSIQMTADRRHNKTYVVLFPDNQPIFQSNLYEIDSNTLEVNYVWNNISYWFFDLQYSSSQSALYGIKVVSTYGRVLSNFTLDKETNDITATELFSIPYMWYVNASTYDVVNNRYFALINYFPYLPESVLDQQLVVADFSSDISVKPVDGKVLPIDNKYGILQFFGYSQKYESVIYASMTNPYQPDNKIVIGVLDVTTATTSTVLFESAGYQVGPLIVQELHNRVLVFMKSSPISRWVLWNISLTAEPYKAVPIKDYSESEYMMIAAACHASL